MRVARVVVRAPVTSFRYPFFVTGRQPTFDVPPPSTILGQCASVLGRRPDTGAFFFGLHFTYRSRGVDLEHQHITTGSSGRTRIRVPADGGEAPATTTATVVPCLREFLFDVTMTLYLDPGMAAAYRSPAHTLTLGRSQDLAEVACLEEVTLERGERARIEHTLLPWELRPCIPAGSTLLLTADISEPPKRQASFARFISLHDAVFLGGPGSSRSVLRVPGIDLEDLWCDTSILDDEGFPRGVWLHRPGRRGSAGDA
jgi:CRISPR-associated protein Cas5t